MVLPSYVYFPPDSFIGRPLASSAGWGGCLSPAHSMQHATHDLGSIFSLAGRSARSSTQLECTNPLREHGTGTRRMSLNPAAGGFRASAQCENVSLLLLLPSFLLVGFALGLEPLPPPESLVATVLSTVPFGVNTLLYNAVIALV